VIAGRPPFSLFMEAVIGLEIHAELATQSKMFCACPVVHSAQAAPNCCVCPVCAGMPGVLPVINRQAVEYGLRVALALNCQVAPVSIFARKNYFYPDLPKGYQITQYDRPLAQHGYLLIQTSQGERQVRIRRVHLEEDAGKLTHTQIDDQPCSLVDLNRAGVPLLEIVSEPDLHTPEEVRAYATALRAILRYVGANSGDMEKGVLRIEPNISLRPTGSTALGSRTEIKNLNSFRALERATAYEIERQAALLSQGQPVRQETRGWDEASGQTTLQRVKEQAEDYRYFAEPDLPPLVVEPGWLEAVRQSLPELPAARQQRFQAQYGLSAYDAAVLVEERSVADYYEQSAAAAQGIAPKVIANWVSGELFALLNKAGLEIAACPVSPVALAGLLGMVARGEVSQASAKGVLAEAFASGQEPSAIVNTRGLRQVSDTAAITELVRQVLAENLSQAAAYRGGKEALFQWFFGQVMRRGKGQANPQVVKQVLLDLLHEQP